MTIPQTSSLDCSRGTAQVRELLPGLALSVAVAVAASVAAPLVASAVPIPAMVIALFIGIAINPIAARPAFQPGTTFAVNKLLRWAVALLGLRIALGDIVELGLPVAALVTVAMAGTVAFGLILARVLGQRSEYGALAGVGTAVCGASATLAAAAVLPSYSGKQADVVFVVVAVNALSTLAMVLYPPLCFWLGFGPQMTGAMLGATIHDVAQVVGAGYGVSEPVGNAAVVVKLFRVFLLFPAVLAVGWWFARAGTKTGQAKAPIPVFALVFVLLCLVNSAMPSLPALAPVYTPLKSALVQLSTWGLLVAIAALGLGTSLGAIRTLGWRHVTTMTGTTAILLIAIALGLAQLR